MKKKAEKLGEFIAYVLIAGVGLVVLGFLLRLIRWSWFGY